MLMISSKKCELSSTHITIVIKCIEVQRTRRLLHQLTNSYHLWRYYVLDNIWFTISRMMSRDRDHHFAWHTYAVIMPLSYDNLTIITQSSFAVTVQHNRLARTRSYSSTFECVYRAHMKARHNIDRCNHHFCFLIASKNLAFILRTTIARKGRFHCVYRDFSHDSVISRISSTLELLALTFLYKIASRHWPESVTKSLLEFPKLWSFELERKHNRIEWHH